MSPSTPQSPPSRVAEPAQIRVRGPFKAERLRIKMWRMRRPFWAGLFTLFSSAPILYFPYATMHIGNVSIAMSTMAGASSAIIGILLIATAMMMWFQPQFRIFAGVATLVMGFVSFVTSNLGGFLIGLLLATLGGALALAWAPDELPDEDGDPAPPSATEDGGDGLGVLEPALAAGTVPPMPETAPGAVPAPRPESATEVLPAAVPDAEGGDGLGGSEAGRPTGRPGPNDGDDGEFRDPMAPRRVGLAKYAAVTVPAVAVLAAVLPLASPSDPLPASPYAAGPCVSASPSPSASVSPSPSPSLSSSPSPSASHSAAPKATPAAPAPTAAPPAVPVAPAATSQAPVAPTPTPTPTPVNPLQSLWDRLTAPFQPHTPTPAAPTPTPTPTPKPAAPQVPAPTKPPVAVASTPAPSATSKPTPTASATPSSAPSAAPSPTVSSDTSASPYPCPSQGPVHAAAADSTDPVLPPQPWILHSSLLAMAGMDYKGVVNIKHADGTTTPVLEFKVSGGIDIWNLDMTSPVEDGKRIHVSSAPNSKSYMDNGTVTFYTESIKGNLFGLIPVEFTPTSPPPINTPVAFFTDVVVTQAGQTGATLVIPGMNMRSEKA